MMPEQRRETPEERRKRKEKRIIIPQTERVASTFQLMEIPRVLTRLQKHFIPLILPQVPLVGRRIPKGYKHAGRILKEGEKLIFDVFALQKRVNGEIKESLTEEEKRMIMTFLKRLN